LQTPADHLNTIPIQQFIQHVKSADNSRAKEVKIDIQQAKNLAFTLGIVMGRLNGDLEKLLLERSQTEEVIRIEMDGGGLE
jgi:hypothetical protein